VSDARRIARYTLLDEVASRREDKDVVLWRGFDEVLARDVSIRLLPQDDPRASRVIAAAQASALVEDRRLLRVLDIFQVPATSDSVATIAIVSEWATGVTLEEMMRAQSWEPLPLEQAMSIVDDVARAIAAGAETSVSHRRLRPSSVIVTDAHEVRVRGLGVDAAIWGQLDPTLSPEAADIDGLGSLLYFLLAGVWPGSGSLPAVGLPRAPRAGGHVLPPSRISANVPRSIDDCITRSVQDAERVRSVLMVNNAPAFVSMLSLSRDYLTSPGETSGIAFSGADGVGTIGRIVAVIGGLVGVAIVALLGWALFTGGEGPWRPNPEAAVAASILTGTATPVTETQVGIEQVIPVTSVTSFDPYADDNENGKVDGRKGRENEADVAQVIDGDTATAWRTSNYGTTDADGKGGMGLILDLGAAHSVNSVSIDFDRVGAQAEVRVSDKIYRDPGTWNLLASAPAGGRSIELRAPRAKVGRYVLLWFPVLPKSPTSAESFSVGVSGVEVRG
jgi:hypothetical protein